MCVCVWERERERIAILFLPNKSMRQHLKLLTNKYIIEMPLDSRVWSPSQFSRPSTVSLTHPLSLSPSYLKPGTHRWLSRKSYSCRQCEALSRTWWKTDFHSYLSRRLPWQLSLCSWISNGPVFRLRTFVCKCFHLLSRSRLDPLLEW